LTSDRSPAASLQGEILVLIPTYNERPNIERLVRELLAQDSRYSVLVIDDSSPDGTGDLVEAMSQEHPGSVSLLRRPLKQGIGPAYIAGMRIALETGATWIVTMDADLSHRPEDLPGLLRAARNADLVLGSRYMPGGATAGWSLGRRLLSRAGGLYARLVLGIPFSDLTGGFKVYNRPALEALRLETLRADGYVFQIETTYRIHRAGLCIEESPIVFVDRIAGKSKLSRRIVLEAMIVVWRLRLRSLEFRIRASES
jgi:dolichol-phosphate mannosyltransferase